MKKANLQQDEDDAQNADQLNITCEAIFHTSESHEKDHEDGKMGST